MKNKNQFIINANENQFGLYNKLQMGHLVFAMQKFWKYLYVVKCFEMCKVFWLIWSGFIKMRFIVVSWKMKNNFPIFINYLWNVVCDEMWNACIKSFININYYQFYNNNMTFVSIMHEKLSLNFTFKLFLSYYHSVQFEVSMKILLWTKNNQNGMFKILKYKFLITPMLILKSHQFRIDISCMIDFKLWELNGILNTIPLLQFLR